MAFKYLTKEVNKDEKVMVEEWNNVACKRRDGKNSLYEQNKTLGRIQLESLKRSAGQRE